MALTHSACGACMPVTAKEILRGIDLVVGPGDGGRACSNGAGKSTPPAFPTVPAREGSITMAA